jgi:hypothetical protein
MRPPARHARPGRPNAGPGARGSRRQADGSVSYVLTGPLAWIERDGRVAVLRVQETNRRGRAFRGRTVTVDVSEARVSAPDRDADGRLTPRDLLPGERVTVRVNLPRRLAELPRTVAARQVVAHDHLA